MVNRNQQILLCLVRATGPLTAEEIGRGIGVCARTVRSEIPEIRSQLESAGASLVAKRNYGYLVKVHDQARYGEFCRRLGIKSMQIALAGYDEATRTLYICRTIIGAPSGIRVDELAEQLSLTRSALRGPLKKAASFFDSYGLKLRTIPRRGLMVSGDEIRMRFAMTELFASHFHKAPADSVDSGYASLIQCDESERQDIRHAYLAVQRASGWSLRDSMTQRVAMYLVISRNRLRDGHGIIIDSETMDLLSGSPILTLARDVLETLMSEFEGFSRDEGEVAALATLLVCNLDLFPGSEPSKAFPSAWSEVEKATNVALESLRVRTGISLADSYGLVEVLRRTLAPLSFSRVLNVDGQERFWHKNEMTHLGSPVALLMACAMVEGLQDELGYKPSDSVVSLLAAYSIWALSTAEYAVRPLRALVTDGMGVEFARRKGERLACRFPDLVSVVRACELYEIRGIDEDDYDVVLTDSLPVSYNYALPRASLRFDEDALSFARIHDEVLIDAYQIDEYLPEPGVLGVVRGFSVASREQFVQTLSMALYLGAAGGGEMVERLVRDAQVTSFWVVGVVGVVADSCDSVDEERILLFELERSITWGGKRLSRLVYARLCLSGGLCSARSRERIITLLVERLSREGDDKIVASLEDPCERGEVIREILRDSLRITPSRPY